MISFRFHLVSLTAIFLALAAGIAIGAGVVDRATVDQIERQLRQVESNRQATRAENEKLQVDLARWGQFSQEAGDRLVAGELVGIGVLLVSVDGVDRNVIDRLRTTLQAAGASMEGTLWFTGKWNLTEETDVRSLANLVPSATTGRAEDVRAAALARIATSWGIGNGGPYVAALRDLGFLDFEVAMPSPAALEQLPRGNTVFVVVSADSADVASTALAAPLVDRMALANVRVAAAQPTRQSGSSEDTQKRPEFIPSLLSDSQVANRVSTIDNIDDYRGRVAAVLAVRALPLGRSGRYGFDPSSEIVPKATP